MKERVRKNNMGGLLVLLLFAVFAVSILSVLLMSADTYRQLTERDSSIYDQRTAAQYLTNRVHQADAAGVVSVRAFEGRDALVISEVYDGVTYETLIYWYDGYLRELFTETGFELAPEWGEPILPADTLRICDEGTYLQMELELPNDSHQTLILRLRSRGEAAA